MAKDIIKRDLAEKLSDLPEVCYSRRISDGAPVLLKRGVIGYWAAKPGVKPEEQNEIMGVDVAKEQAMVCGSLCGFDVPGADPLNYTDPTMYAKLEAFRAENRIKYAGRVFQIEAENA